MLVKWAGLTGDVDHGREVAAWCIVRVVIWLGWCADVWLLAIYPQGWYQFAKDASLKRKWVDQVWRTRDKWTPTEHSVLCSEHFDKKDASDKLLLVWGKGSQER